MREESIGSAISRSFMEVCEYADKLSADLAAARAEIEELKRGKSCDGCESFDPLGGYTDGADSHCIGCSRFEPRDNFKPRDPSAEQGGVK